MDGVKHLNAAGDQVRDDAPDTAAGVQHDLAGGVDLIQVIAGSLPAALETWQDQAAQHARRVQQPVLGPQVFTADLENLQVRSGGFQPDAVHLDHNIRKPVEQVAGHIRRFNGAQQPVFKPHQVHGSLNDRAPEPAHQCQVGVFIQAAGCLCGFFQPAGVIHPWPGVIFQRFQGGIGKGRAGYLHVAAAGLLDTPVQYPICILNQTVIPFWFWGCFPST